MARGIKNSNVILGEEYVGLPFVRLSEGNKQRDLEAWAFTGARGKSLGVSASTAHTNKHRESPGNEDHIGSAVVTNFILNEFGVICGIREMIYKATATNATSSITSCLLPSNALVTMKRSTMSLLVWSPKDSPMTQDLS